MRAHMAQTQPNSRQEACRAPDSHSPAEVAGSTLGCPAEVTGARSSAPSHIRRRLTLPYDFGSAYGGLLVL